MIFDKDTKLIISISNSPTNFGVTIYNYIFKELSLKYVYLPFKSVKSLEVTNAIKTLDIVGCSISSPLKTEMVQHMDELDETVKKLNNLNTIKNVSGCLKGFNTDYFGFNEVLKNREINSVLLYGTGSVSKTILQALVDRGVNKIYLEGRTENNIGKLLINFSNWVLPYNGEKIDVFINATPAGNSKNDDLFKYLKNTNLLMDLNVSPIENALILESKAQGIETLKGTEMSMYQLQKQFEIYTGITPGIELIKSGLSKFFKS